MIVELESVIPTFILTNDSSYDEIDVSKFVDKKTRQFSCIVITKKGSFNFKGTYVDGKKNTYFFGPIKLSEIDGLSAKDLEIGDTHIFWSAPKLPESILQESAKFFADVFKHNHSECIVLLFFNANTSEWRLLYPLQINAGYGGVKYAYENNDDLESQHLEIFNKVNSEYKALLKEGFICYGTIHSHCDFSAFHSGVDDTDEINFNGLHITIGNVDKDFSFSQRIAGEGGFIDVKNIDDVVQLSEHWKDFHHIPNMYEQYQDRFITKTIPILPSVWRNNFPGFPKLPSKYMDDDSFYKNESSHWWENNNTALSTKKSKSFHKNDIVLVDLHMMDEVGIVLGRCKTKNINFKYNKSPQELYWVKIDGLKSPILCSDFELEHFNEK